LRVEARLFKNRLADCKSPKGGFFSNKYVHAIGIIGAFIGVASAVLAFASWGTFYTANQAFDQPRLACLNWAFTHAFEMPGLSGPSYRLPSALFVNLTILRTDSFFWSFNPPIKVNWKYALTYRFGGPISGTLPLTSQNQSSFSLDTSQKYNLKWTFNIDDFTRQNDLFNITIESDQLTEAYSAYPGAFGVVHSAQASRFLNLFLPVYDFSRLSNHTLAQMESYNFYFGRAQQAAFAIVGGITSMLSIQPGAGYVSCSPEYNGTAVWI